MAGVVNDEVWFAEVLKFFLGGTDKHIVHEQCVIGAGADHPNLDAVLWIPSGKAVEDVDVVAGIEVIDGTFAVNLECVLVHLNVDRAPPDVIFTRLFVDDALVLGAPAGLLTGEVDERTGGGDDGALVFDGIFVELGGGGVALELDAIHVEASLGEVVEVTTDEFVVVLIVVGLGVVAVEDVGSDIGSLVREDHCCRCALIESVGEERGEGRKEKQRSQKPKLR